MDGVIQCDVGQMPAGVQCYHNICIDRVQQIGVAGIGELKIDRKIESLGLFFPVSHGTLTDIHHMHSHVVFPQALTEMIGELTLASPNVKDRELPLRKVGVRLEHRPNLSAHPFQLRFFLDLPLAAGHATRALPLHLVWSRDRIAGASCSAIRFRADRPVIIDVSIVSAFFLVPLFGLLVFDTGRYHGINFGKIPIVFHNLQQCRIQSTHRVATRRKFFLQSNGEHIGLPLSLRCIGLKGKLFCFFVGDQQCLGNFVRVDAFFVQQIQQVSNCDRAMGRPNQPDVFDPYMHR
mmetsp:Transcript_19962/g.55568  ORF Transcript_19962/g.55568 Transcript_19962/m.55568 type:complete len:292 (-) Transcript_19962:241-1116(-)